MKLQTTESPLARYILLSVAPVVGIFITPSYSTEPVDLPKMFALIVLSFALFGGVLQTLKSNWLKTNKIFLTILSLFLLQMVLVMALNKTPLVQQFYGTFGRNTGLLTYLALGVLALSVSILASTKLNEKIVYSLLILGLVSLFYSSLKTLSADPIKWNNPYNHIIGFLGNPDFESSFLGIAGVAIVALILRQKMSLGYRALLLVLTFYDLFIIYRSQALQGLLVFGAGSAVVIFLFLRDLKLSQKKLVIISYSFVVAIAGTLVVMGSLKIGPLANYLYKVSVRQRGFYWKAAIHMMNSKPITGTGLDSYGDWYLTYRSATAAKLSPTVQSNAAHNVFLDMGAAGGYPLFLLNLSLVLLALVYGVKYLRRNKTYNWAFAALFGAFIAFEAQALISINQIGLAVWGWVFIGALVGTEYNSRLHSGDLETSSSSASKGISRKIKSKRKPGSILVGTTVGFVVGLFVAVPPFMNDHNYRIASQSRQAQAIIKATLKAPEDLGRTLQTAQLLAQSNLNSQALTLVNHIIQINPRSYNAWHLKYQITQTNSPDHKLAVATLNQLDPKSPAIQ